MSRLDDGSGRECHRIRADDLGLRYDPVAVSIYATLWTLKFPRYGDDHTGCDWIEIIAQGVPAHVGMPASGLASAQDPYASFLPPKGAPPAGADGQTMRAVVFVKEGTAKGTARSPQEYVAPLLVLSGQEYATISFGRLHELLCDALRSHRPRLFAESWGPDGRGRVLFEDGSALDLGSESV
jgi:hypothetical protein